MDITTFVRSRLKIRHLHILLALDETLNVSRAAQKLNLAQASVSRTLSEIEEGFGMPFFERHPRGLRRTEQGRELLWAMRQIVGNISALEGIAGQYSALGRGRISIGLHNTSSLAYLAEAVSAFKASHPNVSVTFHDGLLPEFLEDLRYGRLDLVFGRLHPSLRDTGFGTITLARAHMVIVARNTMPAPPENAAELLALPWAVPLPGTPMREEFERFRARHGCPLPDDLIETNNAALLTEILLRQDRYALYPVSIPEQTQPQFGLHLLDWLRSHPFPGEVPVDRSGIIYSTSNAHPPAVSAFLKELQARALGKP
ncbi:MAG: LysR family transcriptional regulator [Tropicimonas sp.]|uniref:LysR family transcriptional regulator n=1 Tax=Tropicimonas sp. TaxID=2067044 RepID=UPI003A84D4F5